MTLKKGNLKSFDSGTYTATIQLTGSFKAYLEGVPVARNIPSSEMVESRDVAVALFNEHNASDAVVIAVYT